MSSLELVLNLFDGEPWGPIPTPQDWQKVEERIARPVPSDFKLLVEHTGGCCIGRVVVGNPAGDGKRYPALSHASLCHQSVVSGDMIREMTGVTMYPEDGGWIPVAHVDREFFMLHDKTDTVALVSGSGWEVHKTGMTFVELMWKLYCDRSLYDELGQSIWMKQRTFFCRL